MTNSTKTLVPHSNSMINDFFLSQSQNHSKKQKHIHALFTILLLLALSWSIYALSSFRSTLLQASGTSKYTASTKACQKLRKQEKKRGCGKTYHTFCPVADCLNLSISGWRRKRSVSSPLNKKRCVHCSS